MSRLTRRTLLRATSAAVGLTAVGGPLSWPVAHAGQARVDPHEEIVRDARMVWRRLPADWRSAPFFGSGALTAQVHRGERANEIDFVLSDGPLAAGAVGSDARLVLGLDGAVTAVDWTLDLWNAELTGTVTTSRGNVAFTALAPAGRRVLLVDLAPSPGEAGAGWQVRLPAEAYGVALPLREWRDGTRRRLVATLAAGGSGSGPVEAIAPDDRGALVAAHREWWHSYYRQSLVSVPDKRIQRFFWIQRFKAASTSTAARDGLPHPFLHTVADGATVPASWTPPAGGFVIPGTGMRSARHGNPVEAWGLPDLWSAYRHRMDERVLREHLYPALVRVLAFYEQFLLEGPAGTLHLPLTHSPGHGNVADSTYDMSLLRWAAARAADGAALLNRPAADVARRRSLADRLAPYHRGVSGVLVGADAPLDRSSALPSHLLWIHPLRETRWDRGTDRALMRSSFDHWASMPESWHGRSLAAAASLATELGAADEAHAYVSRLLHRAGGAGHGLTDNTRYAEDGHSLDAGSFAAAQSVLDMLVRSGHRAGAGTVLEVFPAAHAGWRELSIAGLRTEGAFTVDASRASGRTEWIRVRGTTGAPVIVRHDIEGPLDVWTTGASQPTAHPGGSREVLVRPAPGEHALLVPQGAPRPEAFFRNVSPAGPGTPWGLPAGALPPSSSV